MAQDEQGQDEVIIRLVNGRTRPLFSAVGPGATRANALTGAVVSIGHKGEPDIHRGFVLPEDKPKKQAKSATTTTTDAEGNVTTVEIEPASSHSAALIESLTAHRFSSETEPPSLPTNS